MIQARPAFGIRYSQANSWASRRARTVDALLPTARNHSGWERRRIEVARTRTGGPQMGLFCILGPLTAARKLNRSDPFGLRSQQKKKGAGERGATSGLDPITFMGTL